MPVLSNNHLEIARLISLEMTNRQIAMRFNKKPQTIKNDITIIIRTLKVYGRVGIALWYDREIGRLMRKTG